MSRSSLLKINSHLILEELELAPSAEWEPQSNCWFFARLDRGQGYWLGQPGALDLTPGSVLVLPPARSGVVRASQLAGLRLHWFRFCPDLTSGILSMAEIHLFKKQKQSVRLFPREEEVGRFFEEMLSPNHVPNGFLIRGRMLGLIGLACGCDLSRNPVSIEGPILSASKRMKVLMNQLTEEEFIRSSIEELASFCGCSVRHFSRLFRQAFGVSLRVRQTESRLAKASRLLAETDSRVLLVALDCGYRHLGVFNALFKERFGVTPTEWRQRARTNGSSEAACNGGGSVSNEA